MLPFPISKSEHEVRKRELKSVLSPRTAYNPIVEGDISGIKEIKKRKIVIPLDYNKFNAFRIKK